ncbi:MAG TPA: neuraminidase (sialidase)-like protein, partial [Acidobacteriota bacterium]|nr:neuraminidase (sialidase)-like protein [Acidobacteriota bacterium]
MRKLLLGILAITLSLLLVRGIFPSASKDAPFFESELIFPLEHWHNHSSSIVELPNRDLLVVWFHGSGERTADDVALLGSRKPSGTSEWTEPFLMEDVPGFPDTNCVLFLDPNERLWLIWPTIL